MINLMSSSTNYRMFNVANIYNLIWDIIRLNENKEDEILFIIKKQCGMNFYNSFVAYCIRKDMKFDTI